MNAIGSCFRASAVRYLPGGGLFCPFKNQQVFPIGRVRKFCSGWNHDGFDCCNAIAAKIFHNPLEGGDSPGHRLPHEFSLRKQIRATAGNPRKPDKLLWLSHDVSVTLMLAADGFAVSAFWCTGAGQADVFKLHAPAGGGDFLFGLLQPTNLAASSGCASASTAATLFCFCRRSALCHGKRSESRAKHVATSQRGHRVAVCHFRILSQQSVQEI